MACMLPNTVSDNTLILIENSFLELGNSKLFCTPEEDFLEMIIHPDRRRRYFSDLTINLDEKSRFTQLFIARY